LVVSTGTNSIYLFYLFLQNKPLGIDITIWDVWTVCDDNELGITIWEVWTVCDVNQLENW
jgi:hypothetical protein